MNFVSAINFSTTFSKVIFDQRYISQTDDGFSVVSTKDKKNLKTKDILQLAFSALKILGKNFDSITKNRKQMTLLANALRIYLVRINRKTSLFWRLFSPASIKISICFMILSVKSVIGKIAFKIQSAKEKAFRTKVEYKLKDFYFKLLGTQGIQSEILDGTHLHEALGSLLHDFKRFSLTSINKDELKKIINEFKFVYNVSKRSITGKNLQDEAEVIFERLKKLKVSITTENILPFSEVVMPGGYLEATSSTNRGHSVLYRITIEPDQTFNFRIINTGEGTKAPTNFKKLSERKMHCQQLLADARMRLLDEVDTQKKDLIENDIIKLEVTIKKLKKSISIKDIGFIGLTLEDLSKDFLLQLLTFSSGQKSCKSMHELLLFIQSKLKKKKSNIRFLGSRHSMQGKGNCSSKPVTTWLQERCGKTIHHEFKVFLAKIGVIRFQKLVDKGNLEEGFKKYVATLPKDQRNVNIKELLICLQEDGKKVLLSRQQKHVF